MFFFVGGWGGSEGGLRGHGHCILDTAYKRWNPSPSFRYLILPCSFNAERFPVAPADSSWDSNPQVSAP